MKREKRIKTERQSNIELLRIVAMLMVIICHAIGWSPSFNSMILGSGSFRSIILSLLSGFGKIGVHIFFLISGYFVINKPVKISSLLKIWRKSYIYQILLTIFGIILLLLGVDGIRGFYFSEGVINRVMQSLRPFAFEWWFIVTYLIVLAMSPIICDYIKKIERRKLFIGLSVLTVAFYIMALVNNLSTPQIATDPVLSIITFIITFTIGAYLGLYKPKIKRLHLIVGLSGALSVAFVWSFSVVKLNFNKGFRYDTWNDHFTHLAIALPIFMLFLKLNIQDKRINWLASRSLGVYLLHNGILMNHLLWKIIDLNVIFKSKLIYLAPFVVAIVLYGFFAVIDYILSEKIFKKVIG